MVLLTDDIRWIPEFVLPLAVLPVTLLLAALRKAIPLDEELITLPLMTLPFELLT